MTSEPRPWLPGLMLMIVALVVARPAAAQTPDWLFPDRALLPGLMAGPRDPATLGQLVYDWQSPTAFGPGVAGEVAISGTAALLRLAGSTERDALVLGMEGAVFARFSLDVVTRELVTTDWVFAVPLAWRRGRHWLRLRYYHTSSHLGDEYQRRFGPSSVNFSRDGVDFTAYLRPRGLPDRLGLGIYGALFWSVSSHPEERAIWRGRAGLEMDPYDGALWRPYGSLDVELEEGSTPAPRWTARAGVWLPAVHGRPLRLGLELMVGPSAMGQFAHRRTRRLGLGLYWSA